MPGSNFSRLERSNSKMDKYAASTHITVATGLQLRVQEWTGLIDKRCQYEVPGCTLSVETGSRGGGGQLTRKRVNGPQRVNKTNICFHLPN